MAEISSDVEAGFPPAEEPEHDLPKMSFLEHLEELRKRLIVSIVALLGGFLLCWNFADRIFGWLQQPLAKYLPPGDKLVFTRLTEPFMLYMKVALLAIQNAGSKHRVRSPHWRSK